MPAEAKLYELISHANDIIGGATPISADCGKLCDAACCKGNDAGMLLFPGEAERMKNIQGFNVLMIEYMGERAWLLICDGTCNRATRPLSCRIFPLEPQVDGNGKVTAIPNPRPWVQKMCPLATGEYLDKTFVRRVGEAFDLLSQEPEMFEFMRMRSAELDETGFKKTI